MTFLGLIQYLSDLSSHIVNSPDFQTFGLIILFLWTAIPSSVFISEVILLPLIVTGVSPIVLIIVTTLGITVGNYFVYLFGRGTYRIIKGKNNNQADAQHLLHKYRLPIFITVPFLFVIGDLIVGIAGYERIGFRKILPFLLIGEFLRSILSVLVLMGLIELPNFLNF